jgi:glycerophosphoryl diester phosphodiesterase
MVGVSSAAHVDVVAHRGASAYAPEHSFAAYDLALAQEADVLELDVRRTADGGLVLVHDPTLLRTAGHPRAVDGLTRDAIEELDAATRPPTFEAFLERYAGAPLLLVDLKDPTPEWEGRVVEAIERHALRERAIVQSFDLEALRRLRRRAPWLTLSALLTRELVPCDHLDAAAEFASGVGPWHGAVDAAVVEAARARGLAVRPWTVDDPAEMKRLLGLGVDAIITNAPDVGVAVVRGAPLPAAA